MNAQLQQLASDNLLTDDASITRYRRAILRLSDQMVHAADARVDLSPLLLEALNHALENLLLYGDVAALQSLEEWLDDGEIITGAPDATRRLAPPDSAENNSAVFSARRADAERRAGGDRRKSDCRNTPPDESAIHPAERREKQRRASRNRRA